MKPWMQAAPLCVSLVLIACNPAHTPDVFENYDVRHPAPIALAPGKYGAVDNDAYYSQPNCAGGFDSPTCVNSMERYLHAQ